ncbi:MULTISPECIES: polysaccharide biosynthesis protein [unclassified Bacillus (in: firmicutes)]|uniref:polysaccharide biosynthesis protein n=1 Tax=unclassified Bacillus (in: firmicutes) TaxID=185979 RepID=UPI0008F1EBD3|nr:MULTISPECIES: polysaccharide biosynthesis protein [unclassified Bacillus (in: firmicutes)]SFA72243.1 Polysaccharide biosynthesis protein [Bacillus sp. UNCCL13]SFQ62463.1 Polysaccharide biosynthesis protein [Bacillus sp. cl95]
MFKDSVILVTGGTGSWGKELIVQLLTHDPKEIIIFSRNEDTQVKMRRDYQDPRLNFRIGDIRDKEALFQAFKGVDYVFHLAALKHVPICEEHPMEALKTNVTGTQNVIDAAIFNEVKKVINVSTDKAADPANFYGFTKAIGEKLIIHANLLTTNTKFVCVRGGNVLGTNGSVLHLFIDQIKNKKEITITDKRMTRFFLTKEDAIKLLLKASTDGKGGEIFVINMPACKIIDLAEVLIEHFEKEVNIIETGPRPGEKLHEVLVSHNEIEDTVVYNQEYFVVLPDINTPGVRELYSACQPISESSYSSKDHLMTHEEIKKMLVQSKLLY